MGAPSSGLLKCVAQEQTWVLSVYGMAQEKIVFADDMLVRNAVAKIDDGDIILTYGYSSIVFSIFMQAQKVHSPSTLCFHVQSADLCSS